MRKHIVFLYLRPIIHADIKKDFLIFQYQEELYHKCNIYAINSEKSFGNQERTKFVDS